MANYIDTREGWREVTRTEWGFHEADDDSVVVRIDGVRRFFVRAEPLPVLPVKEGLYQEQYSDGTWGRVWELGDDGKWQALQGDSAELGQWPLHPLEPKSKTVETVVDWLRGESWASDHADDVAHEFEVE